MFYSVDMFMCLWSLWLCARLLSVLCTRSEVVDARDDGTIYIYIYVYVYCVILLYIYVDWKLDDSCLVCLARPHPYIFRGSSHTARASPAN